MVVALAMGKVRVDMLVKGLVKGKENLARESEVPGTGKERKLKLLVVLRGVNRLHSVILPSFGLGPSYTSRLASQNTPEKNLTDSRCDVSDIQ